MIHVDLVLDSDGALVSATAQGHALHGSPGTDIVCSAVSVLLRTTLAVLEESGVRISVDSAGRGTLFLAVTACKRADIPLLRYAGRFLQRGLCPLAAEYPNAVGVHKKTVENSSIEVLED